ncbi:MAG: hypothetical protein ACFFDI_25550 [Promethearchaeota archaeon]
MQEPIFVVELATLFFSLGAVALSIYTWLKIRRGAIIKPAPFVHVGIKTILGNNLLLIPLALINEGLVPGIVSSVDISLEGSSGKKSLAFGRRVERKVVTGQTAHMLQQKDFVGKIPALPLSVPAGQTETFLLEYYDYKHEKILAFDEEMVCTVTVRYGINKVSSIAFPFKINEAELKDRHHTFILWTPIDDDPSHQINVLIDPK